MTMWESRSCQRIIEKQGPQRRNIEISTSPPPNFQRRQNIHFPGESGKIVRAPIAARFKIFRVGDGLKIKPLGAQGPTLIRAREIHGAFKTGGRGGEF